ncbi:MAG: winged helix-turn-helix domain-containing protein [Acidimicrobiia bacterium]|nr:winged helix-turn-helix domain-containing protein [Acidimicrobiia bacterium]
MTTVLVIDHDGRSRARVAAAVRDAGHEVEVADDTRHAGTIIRRRQLSAIVVDPAGDAETTVGELRRQTDVPMIVLSPEDGSEHRIAALDAGADDYLAKPFVIEELLARLRVWLRRAARRDETPPVATPDFVIQLDNRRVLSGDGTDIVLTPTEWRLVETLARRPGQLVDHEDLLQRVWGAKGSGRTDYLRVYMAAIRRKLEPDPARPRYFVTVPGVGHRFINTTDTERLMVGS